MNNDVDRVMAWWNDLDDRRRSEIARLAGDQLPGWVATSLSNEGVAIVEDASAAGTEGWFLTPHALLEVVHNATPEGGQNP